jgi:hypothetical protein
MKRAPIHQKPEPNSRPPKSVYPFPDWDEPEKKYCPYCGRRLENGVCPEGPHSRRDHWPNIIRDDR